MVEINPAPDEDNCGVCHGPFADNDMRYVDWSTDDDSDTHTGRIHLRCKSKSVHPKGNCGVCDGIITVGDWASPVGDAWVHLKCQATRDNVTSLATEVNYTQLRMVCRACNLHFIVCTERPESHGLSTMYCPECGQHDARFIMYEATVPGFIFQSVPGDAEVKDIKL